MKKQFLKNTKYERVNSEIWDRIHIVPPYKKLCHILPPYKKLCPRNFQYLTSNHNNVGKNTIRLQTNKANRLCTISSQLPMALPKGFPHDQILRYVQDRYVTSDRTCSTTMCRFQDMTKNKLMILQHSNLTLLYGCV